MRTHQLAWLLPGFLALAGSAQAQDFTVGGWLFDETCVPHKEVVTKAYEDALTMATKAQNDLTLVLPRFETRKNPRQVEQYRIARAMGRCFGFMADIKQDNAKTDKYWSRVTGIFDKMVSGMTGPEPTTPFFYNTPMFICKDDVWKWLGADDLGPEAPDLESPEYDEEAKEQLKEKFKMKNLYPEKFAEGYSGGWYYKQRMDWRKNVAQKNPAHWCDGAAATTKFYLDAIHICEASFTDEKYTKRPSAVGYEVTIGKKGTKISTFDSSLSHTLVHELTHWYGTENGQPGAAITRELIDQQSVDAKGNWLYKDENGKSVAKSTKKKRKGLVEDQTYGFNDISNLGEKLGPDYSTETAESYAFFAVMAILDSADFATTGTAAKKHYPGPPALPLKLRV